jgi:hypothetical protein
MSDILLQQWKASPEAFASGAGDETVLLQVQQGAYFGFEEIGTRLWAGMNAGRSSADLCREIAEEFGVPLGTVERDARAFLEDLRANSIIVAA